ncbi:MAG: alpha/beta fold hydrolase [Anaerolineae bacterium]|nr:alpha/beta fold hydrolase [Anaerolineae bacterium]
MDTQELFIGRFSGPEHHAFVWQGGEPAVVLVHGFPGSPAELRPLGEVFRAAGWTAHGLLLPGFGPDLATLFDRRYDEWVTAACEAVETLRRDHAPVILLGHSMGGAVALCAAAKVSPDGLILLAPFWRFAFQTMVFRLLWPLLRHVIRQIRPFTRLDPQSRDVRVAVRQVFPDLDLDDPAVLAELRHFSVPTGVFEQLRRAGAAGYATAPQLRVPTLVLQGLQDGLVTLQGTRSLVTRISAPLHYREIQGPHELLDPNAVSWPIVSAATLDFAREIAISRQSR